MHSAADAPAGVAFGRFRVSPHRRQLLADGHPIELPSCCATRAVPLMPSHSSRRSTTGSPRGSTPPTSEPQKRFSPPS